MKTIVLIARIIVVILIALFVFRFIASAQQPVILPDLDISAATRTAVIDNLIKELNDGYV